MLSVDERDDFCPSKGQDRRACASGADSMCRAVFRYLVHDLAADGLLRRRFAKSAASTQPSFSRARLRSFGSGLDLSESEDSRFRLARAQPSAPATTFRSSCSSSPSSSTARAHDLHLQRVGFDIAHLRRITVLPLAPIFNTATGSVALPRLPRPSTTPATTDINLVHA